MARNSSSFSESRGALIGRVRPRRAWSCFLGLLALAGVVRADEPNAPAGPLIRVETGHAVLLLATAANGRVYQVQFGARSAGDVPLPKNLPWPQECYPQWGDGFIGEPALQATHADGNTSTDLLFVRQETTPEGEGVATTRIELKDPAYPFFVTICFRAYIDFDVIEQWTEIQHGEPAAVTLERFASSSPLFNGELYLTQYHGSYSQEVNPAEERLTAGIKILDSKIDVRADYYRLPSFLVSREGPAQENKGEVWAGSLAWPGSFQFAFEKEYGVTRALCGMNPFASEDKLEPGETFVTPAMTWAWSNAGTGPLSRNLHRWVRRYRVRDGDRPRAVMLNNWEATHTGFDEKKLVSLFDGARALGLELFLLDDGWFGGTKYPRNNDAVGLGDWQAAPSKLPDGIHYLCEQAKARGLRFGLWMEPEMVNPKSVLFEQHPDWAIQQPHRELQTRGQRNQLVLDLTRPAVQEFAHRTMDDLLTQNPGISYLKWDCNRYLTQPGSPWLKPEKQSQLDIEYNRALLDLMKDVATRHPQVEMMVCAGGGGRVDYGSLRYFHEFWPSDNTDPLRRVTMQWDYSTFFPAITISSHVTRWGNRPHKFAFDVAMSGRLGLDLDLSKLTPGELAFAGAAVSTYKDQVRQTVQFGDLYRVENPHVGPRAVLDYVSADRSLAVLFVLQTKNAPAAPAHPEGLDPQRSYRVTELDLPPGAASTLPFDGKVVTGAALMRDGLIPACTKSCDSAVVELAVQ